MRTLLMLMLACLPLLAQAQVERQIIFQGQNAEVIKIDKQVTVVNKVPYEVPSTCTRDVPYQSYECRDVVRHREQCSWIPSSERCWTETDRVCRPVTRSRQECSSGPSRRECTSIPSREVCTDRPTRTVCRTGADGRERCTEVGGGRSCQTVGGGQSCRDVPGERVCRTVNYTEQDCDNVSRRRCETIPGRNQCHSIPYTENVCGNETRYRSESYACTRTQYRDVSTAKKVSGEVRVHIVTNGLVEEFPFLVSVNPVSQEYEAFKIDVKLVKEPKVFVVLRKKNIKIASASAKEIVLEGNVTLEVLEPRMIQVAFPVITAAAINEDTSVLKVNLQGPISADGSFELELNHKRRTLAELKALYPSERAKVSESAGKLTLEFSLKDLLQGRLRKRKMEMKLKLMAPLNIQGSILNVTQPVTEKVYDDISVDLH
jgi:hypothetical protein